MAELLMILLCACSYDIDKMYERGELRGRDLLKYFITSWSTGLSL